MSHDGTAHSEESGVTTASTRARNIVDLYYRNVNTTATTHDVWQVGDALLDRVEEVAEDGEETAEGLTELEESTEEEFKTVEQRLLEVEEVLAEVIFTLENTGIDITENMENFKNEYLNL